jgi:hypothetical protein
MKRWRKPMTISLLVTAFVPAATHPQEAFLAKELLQNEANSYAGGDLVPSVGEITIAPGARKSRHGRRGLTFVYVPDSAVEIERGGAPAKVYRAEETLYSAEL